MKNNIDGLMKVSKQATDATPLKLHDKAKENKYASAEFSHAEDI